MLRLADHTGIAAERIDDDITNLSKSNLAEYYAEHHAGQTLSHVPPEHQWADAATIEADAATLYDA